MYCQEIIPFAESDVDPEQIFQLLDKIGTGAFGTVYKALHKQNGQLYAAKIVQATLTGQIQAIKKEVTILRECNDEHIVKFYGSYIKQNRLWIILQYCVGGSIGDLMKIINRKLKQQEIATILESVLHGLVYLHSNKKIHRDVKAANILLTQSGIAKLADFGVSATSKHTNAGQLTHVGSPLWMSPEVMRYTSYNYKTDIWSLGVTAVQLAEGGQLFKQIKPCMIMLKLNNSPIRGFTQPQQWSKEFNHFVTQCLQINPQERPESSKLLSHQFIVKKSKGKSLLAQFVAQSMDAIQQYRLNQQRRQEEEGDEIEQELRMQGQTRTVVGGRIGSLIQVKKSKQSKGSIVLNKSREYSDEQYPGIKKHNESSYSQQVNDCDGSMVVHDHVQVDGGDKGMSSSSPLTEYISSLQQESTEQNSSLSKFQQKLDLLDERCREELNEVYTKWKQMGEEIVGTVEGLKCHLIESKNMVEFINGGTKSNTNAKHEKDKGIDKVKGMDMLKGMDIVKGMDIAKSMDMLKDMDKIKGDQKREKEKQGNNFPFNHNFKKQPQGKAQSDINQKNSQKNTQKNKIQTKIPASKNQDNSLRSSTSPNNSCYSPDPVLRQSNHLRIQSPPVTTHLNTHTNTSHNTSMAYAGKRFIATEPHEIEGKKERGQIDCSLKLRQFMQDPDVKQNLLNQLHPQIIQKYMTSNDNNAKNNNYTDPNSKQYSHPSEGNRQKQKGNSKLNKYSNEQEQEQEQQICYYNDHSQNESNSNNELINNLFMPTHSPSIAASNSRQLIHHHPQSSTQPFHIPKAIYQGKQDYLILNQEAAKGGAGWYSNYPNNINHSNNHIAGIGKGKIGSRKKVKMGKSGEYKKGAVHHASTNTQGGASNFNSSVSYTKSTSNILSGASSIAFNKNKSRQH